MISMRIRTRGRRGRRRAGAPHIRTGLHRADTSTRSKELEGTAHSGCMVPLRLVVSAAPTNDECPCAVACHATLVLPALLTLLLSPVGFFQRRLGSRSTLVINIGTGGMTPGGP